MAIQFTRNGRKAMLWAQVEAMRRGELYVEPEHLLLGLLHGDDTGALRLLDRMGMTGGQIREAIASTLAPEAAGTRVETSQLSPSAKKVVEQARRETETTGADYVGTEHLVLAILRGNDKGIDLKGALFTLLTTLGLTYEKAREAQKSVAEDPPLAKPAVAPPVQRPIRSGPGFLRGRSLVSVNDVSTDEIRALFNLTRDVKMGKMFDVAQGKTLALVFEKPSLRTRVTFSVAMTRLGGNHLYLSPSEVGLGTREPAKDVARVLGRMVDAIAARTFADQSVRELAEYAGVPVINALTDAEHPCQALADFYTILERRSETAGVKFVFVGDGNNVAHSLMLLAPRMGTHFTLACPPGYEPSPDVLAQAQALAKAHGTQMEVSHDPVKAADDADVLYTDVWTSMGQEDEKAKRLQDFAGYQIGPELIREAKDDVLILHCLPAHRGEEITDEAIEGPHSGVFDQAENRLHVQQALLAAVL